MGLEVLFDPCVLFLFQIERAIVRERCDGCLLDVEAEAAFEQTGGRAAIVFETLVVLEGSVLALQYRACDVLSLCRQEKENT